MKLVITAPDPFFSNSHPTLFLGGGISNCPNWQADIIPLITASNVWIYNPRRQDFDITDSNVSKQQIEWEHSNLNKCEVIAFWFPKETLCPITLFELGYQLGRRRVTRSRLCIGVHTDYARKFDVEHQCRLNGIRDIKYSITDLATAINNTISDLDKY